MELLNYELRINGNMHVVTDGWIGESLLYVLRERLGLPGAKNACEQGECGSCSVLLDGDLVCSCLVLAAAAPGASITTVEGIAEFDPHAAATADARDLSSVQQAFVDTGAVQCGFCTPGLIVAVHDLLEQNPSPSDLEIREAISGNLCRCTGYGRIFAAVESAQAIRATPVSIRTTSASSSNETS